MYGNDVVLGDHAPATAARRAAAVAVDAVMIVGSPPLLLPACYVLLVVSAVWVIPLWCMSVAGTVLMLRGRRQTNGDRLTSGQLLTGLTVLRSEAAYRVVTGSDAPEAARPSASRVAAARWAFGLVAVAAAGVWGTLAWLLTIIPR